MLEKPYTMSGTSEGKSVMSRTLETEKLKKQFSSKKHTKIHLKPLGRVKMRRRAEHREEGELSKKKAGVQTCASESGKGKKSRLMLKTWKGDLDWGTRILVAQRDPASRGSRPTATQSGHDGQMDAEKKFER